jgi:protein-S-isoprenylcysteine O-methyltransferase Ste14
MLSRGAALTFLADVSGWLLAGPERMLYAMEVLERRQIRLQTRSEERPTRQEGLRIRAAFVSVVWFIVAISVLTSRQSVSLVASLSGCLLLGFWGLWTIWMLDLLRRVAKQ